MNKNDQVSIGNNDNVSEKLYSKNAFLKSADFKDKKDLIIVLLEENKLYSKKDVETIINKYLKRRGF